MKKKVLIVLRYANDYAYCRSYMCNKNDIPKVGDKIFLLVSYGTVVFVEKVDDYYECEVTEGLSNEE